MPIYATAADLEQYMRDNPEVSFAPGPEADRLLERAERDVDRVAGPWPLFSNGRKFDPAQLTAPQQAALQRATCAAAEYRLTVGEAELVGGDEFAPAQLAVLTRAGRPPGPRALEELVGSGLLGYAGMPVEPTVV